MRSCPFHTHFPCLLIGKGKKKDCVVTLQFKWWKYFQISVVSNFQSSTDEWVHLRTSMCMEFCIFSDFKLHFNLLWSGYATDNIIRVLRGERIGTVFHKDAHLWTSIKEVSAHEMAVAARNSSRRLQASKVAYLKCEEKGSLSLISLSISNLIYTNFFLVIAKKMNADRKSRGII